MYLYVCICVYIHKFKHKVAVDGADNFHVVLYCIVHTLLCVCNNINTTVFEIKTICIVLKLNAAHEIRALCLPFSTNEKVFMWMQIRIQQSAPAFNATIPQNKHVIFSDRTRSALKVSDFFFRLLDPKSHKRLDDNIKYMRSFTQGVISERRKILEKNLTANNETSNIEEDFGTKKRAAFLDVLLQATVDGEPLSDEDIREEVETFMFEGHDTTTSGVSFTLHLISRYPEVQKRLFQEIRDVLGDDKQRPATLRDLQELKYLECVIKESLRVHPPVIWVGRYFPQDVELNGKLFPAGTNLTIAIYNMLNDPDNFKNPHIFDPERFSTENTLKIDPFSYIPFSAGSRNCIGQKFAMLEMKSIISKILRNFELLPLGEKPIMVSSLVLKSANGVNLGLRPRNY